MDTLTHALSGALAGRLLAPRKGVAGASPPPVWQAVAVGTAAATFPDIDFVLGFVSELTYLRGHRGITHSLLLMPIWALLVATLMAGLFRLRRVRDGSANWRAFYLIAIAGIFIHILGDLITQFGTMILAPFSDRRFGLGTTFIIDLGFSGIILAGLLASAIWRRSRLPAGLALTLLAGWVGLSASARHDAIEFARAHAVANDIRIESVDAVPRPASPFNWTAVVFDGERYHYAHINTQRSEPLEVAETDNFIRRLSAAYLPPEMAKWTVRPVFGNGDVGALARQVWDEDKFAFYRWFAMFPMLDQVEPAAGGGVCVNFVDLRFDTPGRDGVPFRYGLCGGASEGWRIFERSTSGRRWIGD